MQSQSNSPIVTFFMLAPLLAIPLLAVFGVPEFNSSKPLAATTEDDIELGDATSQNNRSSLDIDDLFEAKQSKKSSSEKGDSSKHAHHHEQADHHHHNHMQSNQVKTVPAVHTLDGMKGWSLDKDRDSKVAESTAGKSPRKDIGERFEYVKESDLGTASKNNLQAKVRPNSFLELSASPKFDEKQVAFAEFDSPFSEREPSGKETATSIEKTKQNRDVNINHYDGTLPQTWNGAVKRLNSLGIRDFNLQQGVKPNEFHFSCSYTPKNNPRITHRFESEATEPLNAVQNTILQVEEWQKKRSQHE